MSTDVVAPKAAEVTEVEEQALAVGALAGFDQEDLTFPILKITQQLSAEVEAGDAESGQFLNSLTGENHGDEVELIVSGYFKGRFYAPKDSNDTFNAQGDVAPNNWPEEYAGRRFDEIEDAEEQTKLVANAPGGTWVAPLVQTTHNYIGFLPEDLEMPVRLSLKSTGTRAHRKIVTLLRFAPGGRAWANVIDLKTVRKTNKQDKPYFEPVATRGRETSPEEQQAAVRLAQDFQAGVKNVVLSGETDERAEERAAVAGDTGGLDVA